MRDDVNAEQIVLITLREILPGKEKRGIQSFPFVIRPSGRVHDHLLAQSSDVSQKTRGASLSGCQACRKCRRKAT